MQYATTDAMVAVLRAFFDREFLKQNPPPLPPPPSSLPSPPSPLPWIPAIELTSRDMLARLFPREGETPQKVASFLKKKFFAALLIFSYTCELHNPMDSGYSTVNLLALSLTENPCWIMYSVQHWFLHESSPDVIVLHYMWPVAGLYWEAGKKIREMFFLLQIKFCHCTSTELGSYSALP